jgi:hypothetical protein
VIDPNSFDFDSDKLSKLSLEEHLESPGRLVLDELWGSWKR